MGYLNDLFVVDPDRSKLFQIIDDAVKNSYDIADYPTAVCVDLNQIDTWVVFTKSNRIGQFRDGKFVNFITVQKTPMGITQAPDGSLWVTNYGSGTVTKIVNGVVVMNISVGTGPRGVCASPDGVVWVSNYLSNTVSKIVNGINVTPTGIAVALNPYGICSDKFNNIYVACTTSNIVSKITGILKVLDIKVGKVPYGVCCDPNNNIWVTNFYGGTVQKIVAGVAQSPISVGTGPFAIAPAKKGAIYVLNYLSGDASEIVDGVVVETIPITTNPHSFGDFTGYQAYLLFKESTGGTPSGSVSYDDLDPALQQMIKSISLPIAAKDVSYDNTDYPTAKSAFDYLLYKAPAISTFSNNVGTVEMGTTVSAVTLNWALNKTMLSQNISGGVGDVPVGTLSKALTGLSLTADTDWTLTVTDEKSATAVKTTGIRFQNKRYWGASANATLANADILALSGELATNYGMSKTIDATGSKYLYFAVPSSFNLTENNFKIGGLANTDWVKTTLAFRNASGYTTNYDVFRSTNAQTGNAILVDVA